MFNIYGEKRAKTNVFFHLSVSDIKRNNVTDHEALIKLCFIKRDHWPIEWADPYCPGFITLWIQIQDTVTVSQHTTWILHARFPPNNQNMFTMALDHQVQVFSVSKTQPWASGSEKSSWIWDQVFPYTCIWTICKAPPPSQTCLKETWYVERNTEQYPPSWTQSLFWEPDQLLSMTTTEVLPRQMQHVCESEKHWKRIKWRECESVWERALVSTIV